MEIDYLARVRDDSLTAYEPEIAASLAIRVQQGDKMAEEELVGRYSRGLIRFFRRKTNDNDLAEDLHQDAFCIVLERLRADGLENPSHLACFLHDTAKNLVIAHFRKQARRKTGPNSAAIDSFRHDGLQQNDVAMRHEQANMVRTLLIELRSERDRELLQRFYLGEEDKQSICAVLDLTEKHFDRVVYRARARFRELLLSHEKRS